MTEINLHKDTLNHLHQWLPFAAGILFPFEQHETSADGRIEAMLTKGGVLSREGKLSESAREMFSIIAESSSTSKLKFLVEGDLLDYQVFFANEENRSVALKRSDNGFIMSCPSPTLEILDIIADFSGLGSFGTVPAQWKLSFTESLIAAAIIDLIRQQIFAALARDEDSIEVRLDAAEVTRVAVRDDLRSNWLVWALRSFIPVNFALTEDNLREAVSSLAKKNLLKEENETIIACDQMAVTARRLLHLNCLYLLDRFMVIDESRAEKTRLSIIQNGVRDLLLLETDGESVAWQGISGKVMFAILEASLNIQANEKLTVAKETPLKSDKKNPAPVNLKAEEQKVCLKCSNKLKANARFCNKCGQTVA